MGRKLKKYNSIPKISMMIEAEIIFYRPEEGDVIIPTYAGYSL
jgi:hypothetical protein